jgi:hypothetical protein
MLMSTISYKYIIYIKNIYLKLYYIILYYIILYYIISFSQQHTLQSSFLLQQHNKIITPITIIHVQLFPNILHKLLELLQF